MDKFLYSPESSRVLDGIKGSILTPVIYYDALDPASYAGSGSVTINDISGNGNHGTFQPSANNSLQQTGLYAGDSRWITCGNSSDPEFNTGSFTIENKLFVTYQTFYPDGFLIASTPNSPTNGYGFKIVAPNQLRLYANNSGTPCKVTLYIDGVLRWKGELTTNITLTNGTISYVTLNSYNHITIVYEDVNNMPQGIEARAYTQNRATNSSTFKSFRFYDRVLEEEEVRTNYLADTEGGLIISSAREGYMFDNGGTTAYASIANSSPEFKNLTQFTFGMWVNAYAAPAVNVNLWATSQLTPSKGYSIGIMSAGTISMALRQEAGGYNYVQATNFTIPGYKQWFYYTAKTDGKTLWLYLNGEFKSTITLVHTYTPADTQPILVGQNFNGAMYRPTIWNRVLTDEEIKSTMINGPFSIPNGMIASYVTSDSKEIYMDTVGQNHGSYINGKPVKLNTSPVGQRSGLKTSAGLVVVPDVSSLNPTTALTIEGWLRPSVVTGTRYVIKKTNQYMVSLGTNSISFTVFLNNGAGTTTATIDLVLGRWFHFACTWNGNTAKIVINGTEIVSQAFTGILVTTTNDLLIGRTDNVTTSAAYYGTIENVRLWDKTLTLTEIKANMYSYLPANYPNLIEQWKLNEGIGSVAYGTKGNNGTITGATWTTPSLMNYVGKMLIPRGGAMGYVDCGNNESIKQAKSFTFELTVKGSTLGNATSEYIGGNYGASNTTGMMLIKHSSDKWAFYGRDIDGVSFACLDTVIIGSITTWYHLAGTYNADTQAMSLYVDGVLKSSRVLTKPLAVSSENLLIGAIPSNTNPWNGAIGQVRFWNIARTATEILENKDRTLERHPNLVLNMGFESGYWDASGYGNHGTPVGSPVIEITDNDKLLLNAPIN